MNFLSIFFVRVYIEFPANIENEEFNALLTTILNQEEEIKRLKKELGAAKKKLQNEEQPIIIKHEEMVVQ